MIVGKEDQKKSLAHYLFKAESAKRVFDISSKGLSLVNSYFIISTLSVFAFGFYQLILAFISILRSLGIKFFDGLITIDMRRYFNVGKPEFAKKLFFENTFFKIGIAAVMTVAVFFGADLIAGFYGEDVALLIKWASLLLIINAVQSLTAIFLQSVVSFSQQGLSALKEILKLGLIIFFLTFYEFTILQVIIAHVSAEVVATLVFTIFVFIKKYQKAFKGIIKAKEPLLIPMVKTHGPRIFAIFGMKEVLQDATPWLVKFFVNTEGVALYALAVNLTSFIQDFMPIAGVKPILALKADNLKELRFIFARAVKYTFWLGTMFFVSSILLVPPVVTFLFPDYGPAIPVFYAMIAVLPLYGVVKVIQNTLAALREYGILAMRLVNEIAILFIGSALLLPTIGVMGIGFVYLARHVERTWFLYSRLAKRYGEFKINLRELIIFDERDKGFIKQMFFQARNMFKSGKKA